MYTIIINMVKISIGRGLFNTWGRSLQCQLESRQTVHVSILVFLRPWQDAFTFFFFHPPPIDQTTPSPVHDSHQIGRGKAITCFFRSSRPHLLVLLAHATPRATDGCDFAEIRTGNLLVIGRLLYCCSIQESKLPISSQSVLTRQSVLTETSMYQRYFTTLNVTRNRQKVWRCILL